MAEPLLIARSGNLDLCLLPEMANRHGVVTGATGTGKTVTIQSIIEKFSEIGVPVFVADIKATKLKVNASIQSDQVRVTSKSRDTLQQVIALLKGKSYGVPLQFTNYR